PGRTRPLLSLHDALPISPMPKLGRVSGLGITLTDVSARVREELGLDSTEGALLTDVAEGSEAAQASEQANDVIMKELPAHPQRRDRKSTRLNSSHLGISY